MLDDDIIIQERIRKRNSFGEKTAANFVRGGVELMAGFEPATY